MSSKSIRERDIEQSFVRYAKKRGCLALKLSDSHFNGFPDRSVLMPNGGIFFIEFKAPGKKPSPLQYEVHDKLRGLFFDVYVCDQKGQAETILDRKLAGKG